ncbi:MAG TPA: biotin/lipoyl-containing protein, partial [Vitreimonas sp.]|nr:biotin/lipoyl-containing protein [Vitreimonas sp.]
MAKVTMPQLGESVAEGTVGKWLKQPGDQVAKYEPLLEVITDKVNAEVPSPFEGTLTEILVQEGETVPNNAEIAIISTADEGGAQTGAPAPAGETGTTSDTEGAPDAKPADAGASEIEAAPSEPDSGGPAEQPAPTAHGPAGSDERGPEVTNAPDDAAAGAAPPPATGPTAGAAAGGAPSIQAAASAGSPPTATASAPAGGPGREDARMTPAVRRLLREHGLSPAQIAGTGGGGRITRDDVTAYVEAQRTGQQTNGQSRAGTQAAP